MTRPTGLGGRILSGIILLPQMPRQGGGEDLLAWAFEKFGNYTVKTAYRAFVTQKER